MSPDRTRIKRHRYYDPDVEKVVPKDAIVLDLKAANPNGNPDLVILNILSALRKGTRGCHGAADQIEAQTGGAS